MKHLRLYLIVLLALLGGGCAFDNQPRCTLRPGKKALPPAYPGAAQHWSAVDGTLLPYTFHPGQGPLRGTVIMVPGWDSVSRDFAPLTQVLNQHGYAVYGMEMRGFRYDSLPARRGNAHTWEPWVQDVADFSQFVAQRTPARTPLFLQAQSFGVVAAIPAVVGLRNRVRWAGVILHSPAIAMMQPTPSRVFDVTEALLPGLRVAQLRNIEKQGLALTTDPAFNCAWLHSSDRVAAGYTLRSLKRSFELGQRAWEDSPRLQIPVLVLRGTNDRLATLARPGAYGQLLTQRLPAASTTVRTYQKGGHLLTAGLEKKSVIRDIVAWTEAHSR